MNLERIMSSESEHFRGIFAENYVACALKANGYELMYWESDGKAEVDFLIIRGDHVIPVECKAAGRSCQGKKSGNLQRKISSGILHQDSTRNFGTAAGIKSVPLYAVFCI